MLKNRTFARATIRAAALLACGTALAAAPRTAGNVDASRLAAADAEPQNWFTGGRDQDGTYYSPLSDINASNVKRLGFAWQYDLGLPKRGQEATPVVVDGVMYTSGTWGYVYAVDAATGRELWRYDPKSDYFAGTTIRAATSSTEASPYGRGRSMSRRATDVCMRSMRRPARRSGKPTPSTITSCRTPAPAHRRSPAM